MTIKKVFEKLRKNPEVSAIAVNRVEALLACVEMAYILNLRTEGAR